MKYFKRSLKKAIQAFGFEIIPNRSSSARMPVEFCDDEKSIISSILGENLSTASPERLWATVMACRYAIEQGIPGDFVECGVWRGGNAMIAAAMFNLLGSDKVVYLFDTFEGMTAPTKRDKYAWSGRSAEQIFRMNQRDSHNEWCYASLEDVRANFDRWGLLSDRVRFVQGDVGITLSEESLLPLRISVLRLDTDWYESTKKELEALYPRLSPGGVLIIDDYGYWAGAREATDEYFQSRRPRPFLQYTDGTGRMGVKPGER